MSNLSDLMEVEEQKDSRIILGDCRDVLKTLPENSVQCVITSPPYFGLRDYGTEIWEGGDSKCDHKGEGINLHETGFGKRVMKRAGRTCKKCGAVRVDEQIGVEQTPEDFVDQLVKVFREVRRVLRPDGTLFLNIGDTYNNGGEKSRDSNIKHKDLIGVPWMLAFALREDGWYLRQDIIWAKKAPSPEPELDRCTRSHEYIFLLSKSDKYFFDAEAIKEDRIDAGRVNRSELKKMLDGDEVDGRDFGEKKMKRSVWWMDTSNSRINHVAMYPEELVRPCILAGTSDGGCCPKCQMPFERVVERRDGVSKGCTDTLTVGWKPVCECGETESIPCVVMDPFNGSGTTGIVAVKLGRHYQGIELLPENVKISEQRIAATPRPRRA